MRLMGPSGVVIDVPDHRARSLLRDHRVKVLDPATPRRKPTAPTEPKPDPVVDEAPDGPEPAAEPAHVCDECGYTARSAAGLAVHKRSHTKVDG